MKVRLAAPDDFMEAKLKHSFTRKRSCEGQDPEDAVRKLNSDYQVYRAVEQELLHKKARLMSKLPDLRKALDTVDLLIEKDGDEVG